jgi:hypothetical protein
MWPRNEIPKAEPSLDGRKQHGRPKSDRCGRLASAGWKRWHGDTGVERFFRDISENRIKRDSFTSVAELERVIDLYVAHHNAAFAATTR